jgi:hypothetical protein
MIKTRGQGRATTIVDHLDPSCAGALTPGGGADERPSCLGDCPRQPRPRTAPRQGRRGVNLYLDNGIRFAFRAGLDAESNYDAVEILDTPKNGSVVFVAEEVDDVPGAIKRIEKAL